MTEKDQLEATKQGVKEAVLQTMLGCTDTPGADIFNSIEEGVKEALLQWLDMNKKEIIESISKIK